MKQPKDDYNTRFSVSDVVESFLLGTGSIVAIEDDKSPPILVRFKSGVQRYQLDGRFNTTDIRADLYPDYTEFLVTETEPEPDWSSLASNRALVYASDGKGYALIAYIPEIAEPFVLIGEDGGGVKNVDYITLEKEDANKDA